MTSPRIQDAEGRELKPGDRVRRLSWKHGWVDDRFVRAGWQPNVGVKAVMASRLLLPTRAGHKFGVYRCPDLELADPQEKEEG